MVCMDFNSIHKWQIILAINMFAICRYQRNSCLYLKWSSFQLWPMRRKIFGSGPKESHYSFIDESCVTDYAKHVRKETKIVKLFLVWRCFVEAIFNGPRRILLHASVFFPLKHRKTLIWANEHVSHYSSGIKLQSNFFWTCFNFFYSFIHSTLYSHILWHELILYEWSKK